MSQNYFRIKQGVSLQPLPSSVSAQGDLAYNSTANTLELFTTALETIVTSSNTLTLTNKTLTTPTIASILNGGTLTLPTATDTLVGRATTDTLTNKTISGSTNTLTNIQDSSLSSNVDLLNAVQTITAVKTFSANPVISQITNTGTLTLPTTTDVLVGRNTTDTLTNKTIGDSVTFTQVTTPANPASGFDKVYTKADNHLYILNSSGVEVQVGSSVLTTAGDMLYENATPANARLPIGTTGQVLTVVGGFPAWTGLGTSTTGVLYTSSAVTTASTAITGTSYATFSNSPALTFTPTVTGTYRVYSNPAVAQVTSATAFAVRIYNTSGGATLLSESAAEGYVQTGGIITLSLYTQSTYTLTAGTSYVFDIQGLNGSTGSIFLEGNNITGVNGFCMYAELVQSTFLGNGVQSVNGQTGAVSTFDSFVSSAVTTTSTGITGSSFATFSNSPALTFTPNFTGKYKVYSPITVQQNTSAIAYAARIFNTSGGATLLSESDSEGYSQSGNITVLPMYVQSTYTLTAGTSYVFDIQGTNNGTGALYLTGSTVSSTNGFCMYAERIG